MSQVSKYDPITVWGGPQTLTPPSATSASSEPSPNPLDRRRNPLQGIARAKFPWWRFAFGILIVAIWIASALQASAASVTLAVSSSKNANNTWDIAIDYRANDIGKALVRLYTNGKRTTVLNGSPGRMMLNGMGDGNYSFVVKTQSLNGGSSVSSNEVRLALGAAPPIAPVSQKKLDAARLLTQASFGPRSLDDINAAEAKGVAAWIDEQFTKPWTSHKAYIDRVKSMGEEEKEEHVYESYWQQLIWGEARLRARVALALSEIMVISNIAPDQKNDAMISWMDMLYRNAFGNYRTLLQEVTLHPAMGYYLNMLGNDKEDAATGRMPNENYAREVLQLFSIGLNELNADGTSKRDGAGKTIATYDQSIVQGFAAAFTGWNFAGNDTTKSSSFDHPKENWTDFMRAWPSRHSSGPKKLLNGAALPAGQTPEKDLADALDNIANNPNVAPFMSKRLIQFLVTSNPSSAYVSRISAVWNNNGQGVRGDMRAVVRAILLDTEARTYSASAANVGKVREPMVKFIHFVNAMQGQSKNGRNSIWWLDSPDDYLGQSPLLAPSVFNFFSPFYTRAGAIAQAGLVVPEMQLVTDTQIVGSANFFTRMINNHGVGFNNDYAVSFATEQWESIANDTNRFLDQLNWVWFAGTMSAETRDIIYRAMNKLDAKEKHERMELAFKLAVIAPEFSVQR
jgi:uncharacterized protein (DUF1800 family)